MLNYAKARELLEEVIREHPDARYSSVEGIIHCAYVTRGHEEDDLVPSCVVGNVVARYFSGDLDRLEQWEISSASNLCDIWDADDLREDTVEPLMVQDFMTPRAYGLLQHVQDQQDRAVRWGELNILDEAALAGKKDAL